MEILRRTVRGILGYNSPIYRAAADLTNSATIVRKEGFGTWRTLKNLAGASATGSDAKTAIKISLSNLQHPIALRPGTEDSSTVVSTVIREEYGQYNPKKEPLVMIDAGSYIGDTSAYFLSRFKNLQIIALEPSKPTYEAARANLLPYGNRVKLLNKGLAAEAGTLRFSGDNTGASLSETGFEIDCTSIPELIEANQLKKIDILKMDIEGAETAIFAHKPERWLNLVDTVMIEIHGPEAERVVLGALAAAGFEAHQYRSIYNCSRPN